MSEPVTGTPALDRGRRAKAIALAAAFALLVALIGGLATDIGPWYRNLHKPSWQPPDWLFGPVWTTIYALAATAGVRAWEGARDVRGRDSVLAAFMGNAVLNVVWSLLFFRLHRPDWALIEVVALWSSIVVLIAVTRRHDRIAPWLLAPYLAWVSFASFLNLTIVRLNAPF